DIAQAQALLEASAGTKTVASEAALLGLPAGAYILIATNERVTWTGSAVTARAPIGGDLIGTRAQRRATTPTGAATWIETDGITVYYRPGTGWRDAYGGDPDAAPPPPDTGVY
ncbi:hypothetical protein IHN63_15490, partial [Deinococcus sp. 6YEL10]|uniref:hypothetical protein n=1 Tax=Deinococcus sp. 6YEL10 TaxID=2745870 RepID=UPI001E544763